MSGAETVAQAEPALKRGADPATGGAGGNGDAGQPTKRSKKGKKHKNNKFLNAEAVAVNPDDYVKVVPLPKRPAADAGWHPVQLCPPEKTSQFVLSEDRRSVTGHRGYRSVRASHGAYEGTWYCEVQITSLGATGHCRLGWATKQADSQTPVGYDEYGFAYRDLEGSRVHKALREPYGEAYATGDVIGLFLHLPPGGQPLEKTNRDIVRYKGQLYYLDEPMPVARPLLGSVVAFTRNGVPQGVAYRDIREGTYYAAAALYTLPEQTEGAMVTFNFGPNFAFPPPTIEGCSLARPVCELAGEKPSVTPAVTPTLPPEDPMAEVKYANQAAVAEGFGAAPAAAVLQQQQQQQQQQQPSAMTEG